MISRTFLLLTAVFGLSAMAETWTVLADDGGRVVLESAQLVQVDYIMAGQGDGVASRFGHSLLRFEFCPQSHCQEDERVAYDVGFAAETSRGYFSAMGGVTGRYPSILTFSLATHSERKYLFEDLREMTIVPLHLSPHERESLLARTVTLFWSTLDQYKFLSNNCAVQMLRLLESSVPDQKLLRTGGLFLTPQHLLEILIADQRAHWPEVRRLNSKRGDLTHYVQALSLDRGLKLIETLDQYAQVRAVERRNWIKKRPNSLAQIFQWQLLEEMVLRKQDAQFSKRALHELFTGKTPLSCGRNRQEMISALESTYDNLSVSRKNVAVEDYAKLKSRYVQALNESLSCFRREPKFAAQTLEWRGTIENLKIVRARFAVHLNN